MSQKPLRTIAEFKSAAETCLRQIQRVVLRLVGAALTILVVGIVALELATPYIDKGTFAILVVVGFVTFSPFMFFCLWRLEKVQKRRFPELECPHCGKWLAVLRFHVISSRNCPHCGRRILAEPGPDDDRTDVR